MNYSINKFSLLYPFITGSAHTFWAFTFALYLLIFSGDYHYLWLGYDFFAIYCLYNVVKRCITAPLLIGVVGLLALLMINFVVHGVYFISILSLWDNLKHVFILMFFIKILNQMSGNDRQLLVSSISTFLGTVFFIQFAMVIFQHNAGYQFDDISGTFGYKASHVLGYFCFLYIAFLIFIRKRVDLYLSLVLLMSIYMNYLAENVGFYVLLIALMFMKNIRVGVYGGVVIVLAIFTSDVIYQYFDTIILHRIQDFFVFPGIDEFDPSTVVSRSTMTVYAFSLGGYFGGGIGAFTDIYNMSGWQFHDLENKQVSISTFTTLLAEYGIFGFLLMMYSYIVILLQSVKENKNKIIILAVFLLSVLYNRSLMDERVIYQLIFVFMFIKLSEIHKVYLVK